MFSPFCSLLRLFGSPAYSWSAFRDQCVGVALPIIVIVAFLVHFDMSGSLCLVLLISCDRRALISPRRRTNTSLYLQLVSEWNGWLRTTNTRSDALKRITETHSVHESSEADKSDRKSGGKNTIQHIHASSGEHVNIGKRRSRS